MATNETKIEPSSSFSEQATYEFGAFRVDSDQGILLHNGQKVRLAPKTFEMLCLLLAQNRKVIDKETLMNTLWPDSFVEDANITVHISNLRKIFAADPANSATIETFPKVGYRLSANLVSGALPGESSEKASEAGFKTEPAAASVDEHVPVNNTGRTWSIGIPWTLLALTGVVILAILVGNAFVSPRLNGLFGRPQMSMTRVPGTEHSGPFVISPNGEYMAHGVESGGKLTLMMTHLGSGSFVQLQPPDAVSYGAMTFTPDNNFLYFGKRGSDTTTLFKIPFLGGPVTKILDNVPGQVGFSPDGSKFCFVRRLPNKVSIIMTSTSDGADVREIARREPPGSYSINDISWSPDGKFIAVTAKNGEANPDTVIATVDVHTGTETALTEQRWSGSDGLQWLGDGTAIVASLFEKPQSETNVWYIPYPKGEPRKITADLENYGRISVSSDSMTIAAGQFRDNTSLWVIPSDAPDEAKRLNAGKHHRFQWVRWMPDGGIVFGSDASKNRDVWRMNLDGTSERQLTTGPQANVMPVATADGEYVVFSAYRDDNGLFELWRMRPDGSDQFRLTNGGGAWQPAVSPDGKWIFYTSGVMGGPINERRIWKVSINGGNALPVSDRVGYYPTLSPDGNFCAYLTRSDDKGKLHIAIISNDGSKTEKLVEIPSTDRIDWTPDSKSISYVQTIDDVSNVWTQPVDGGPPKQETNFTSETITNFDWSNDGRLLVSRLIKTRDIVLIRNFR